MSRHIARLALVSLLASAWLPPYVLAQVVELEEEQLPAADTLDAPAEETQSNEDEAAMAMGAAGSEPDEPAYGFNALLPSLANPNDPTLSKKLAEQSLVNLFQGAGEFRVPITVPPGINGHTPSVALQYSSHQARQNGPIGFGWSLELGTIRRVRRGPMTTLYATPSFYLSLPDVQGELTLLATDGNLETYGLRRERDFARIEHDTAAGTWSVTRKDGRRYQLGTTSASRTQNLDGSKIYSWHVDVDRDTFGNEIEYNYQRIGNVLYPASIRYGAAAGGTHPFDVEFSLAGRVDNRIDYTAGFATKRQHTIDEIRILIQDEERLRYELSYGTDLVESRSDLEQITVAGTNGATETSHQLQVAYYRLSDENVGPRGNLLRSVTLPTGGTLTYDYTPAPQIREEGELANHRPHFPLLVVTSLTRSDFTGRSDETDYSYRDGHFYFDGEQDREIAGFGRTTVTDPLGQITRHYFHQGGGFDGTSLGEAADNWYLIGKPYRHEVFDDQETLLERSITRWATTSLGEERAFVAAVDEISTRMGTVETDRSRATTTVYDPTNGNVIETIEHGEVTAGNDGVFTDVGADSRRTSISYVANPAKHILALPKTEKHYDHAGALVAQTDFRYDDLPLGQVDQGAKTHEIAHLLEESRQLVTERIYNAAVQLERTIDPRGHQQRIGYDAIGVEPAWIENDLAHRTEYEVDPLTAKINRETDANGLVTERTYDGLGRETLRRQSHPLYGNALQPVERVTYDDDSRPGFVLTETFLSPTATSRQIAYQDGFQQTLQLRREASGGADRFSVTNTSYDPLGRTTSETLAVFGTGLAYNPSETSPHHKATSYDALDRVTSIQDSNGTENVEYDAWTRTVTDANGNSRGFTHDAYDRLAQITEKIAGVFYDTTYAYNSRDALVKIVDATDNQRTFAYDSLNRLRVATDLHQPADTTFGRVRWFYDDAGNVSLMVDAAGRHAASTYDELNRPAVRTFTGSSLATQTIALTYDQGILGRGRLTEAATGDWHWEGTYNIRQQLTEETATIGDDDYARNHSYTYFDQPNSTLYPNGLVASYEYNNIGELDGIEIDGETVVSDVAYNPASKITEIDYGNGRTSALTYDPAQMYRLAAKQTYATAAPGNLLQDLTYGYDPVGNVTTLAENAPTAAEREATYVYDSINRLKKATITAAAPGNYAREFAYGPTGNITLGSSNAYYYDQPGTTNPHAVTRILKRGHQRTLNYDASGNLTEYQSTMIGVTRQHHHQWDSQSLLQSTSINGPGGFNSSSDYLYDHDRRRVQKTVHTVSCGNSSSSSSSSSSTSSSSSSSSSSHLCNPDEIAESRYPFDDYEVQDGGRARVHLFADGLHVATAESGSCGGGSDHSGCNIDLYFHHDDHLGGASLVTDQQGNLVQLLDYYPYGSTRLDEQAADYDSTQDFTGHELDDESGLHYAGARYYGSDYGRFISQDPLQWRIKELHERFGENPQGLNFYSYALNNPLVLTDPTGEFACGGICLMLLSLSAAYMLDDANVAIAPSSTNESTGAPNSAPSLGVGALTNASNALDQRGLGNVSRVVGTAGIAAVGVGAAKGGLQPTKAIDAVGTVLDIMDTMNRIDEGKVHRHRNDGTTHYNKSGDLPTNEPGYYTEYVMSGRDLDDKDHPRRMVYGARGEKYYTPDHYKSFRRVDRWLDRFRRWRR